MKSNLLHLICCLLFWSFTTINAQEWSEKMKDRSSNVNDIINDFNNSWGNRPYQRGYGWKQFKRWQDFWEPRVYPHGIRPPHNHAWKEHKNFQRTYPHVSSASRASNWTSMGPSSWTTNSYNPGLGRVNVVAEDPNDPNTIYIGAPSGGCWKSTDAGSTWTVLTDDFQSLGVSAIAVDYTNSNTIYIGTGDDDGGDTYSIGMFKSIDGGATWNEVNPSSSSIFGNKIHKIIIHPTNNNTIFTIATSGCHKSTDGGNTWTLLQAGQWMDMELKPGDPNTIYLSAKTFYKSVDGGNTWSFINTGLPVSFDINRSEIAVSAANPDYVYFLCGKNSNSSFYGLYRSENSGTSFTLQANSPNIFAYDMTGADVTSGQSWYDMALTASPTNAEEIYVGGINVWQSLDGGVTYNIKSHWVYPSSVGYVHADIHTLEFFGNRLYCGSDGGIFKSTNNGQNFTDLTSGLNITQFYSIGSSEQVPHKVIGGTQDNGTNIMENGSLLHIRGADGMVCLISPNDSLVMYSSSQYGNFKRSDDGGNNFQNIFPTEAGNGAWVTPMVINPQDNDMLLAGYSEVYFSLDKGMTDTKISNFNVGMIKNLAIAPSAGYTHFYAGTNNILYATYNSGQNWTNITSGLPPAAMTSVTVHPTDPLHLWVTFSGYQSGNKVFESEDGGASWTNISGNLPNLPINCLEYQTGGGIYVGTDVGVYYKDDILAGWQQFMTGLPNVIVRDLEINYTAGKIRAGTYGRGLWESPLQAPVTTPPTANFSYSSNQVCSSDSIEFTDLSIDHAAGWTWYFPGGNPSSSSLSHPKVAYSASGIYNVTLIVQNPIGPDTIIKAVPVDFQPNELQFDLQLDNNPIEVSWNLKKDNGTTIFSSPTFAYSGQDSQFIQHDFCLDSGCYILTMIDLGGNGLCCSNGIGYYLMINSTGDTLAFGSNYTSIDTITFCVNQRNVLAAGLSVTDATCGLNNGTIEVIAIGGDGNYQYSIDNGNTFQISPSFNVVPGNYTILTADGTGQQISNIAVVGETEIPVALASANASTVFLNQGGTVNLFSANSVYASSILWTFPDGSTSTQAAPDFTFTNGGIQQIILSVSNGNCTDSDTLIFDVTDNVSTDKIDNEANISIVPNPVSDKFTLKIELTEMQGEVEIIIHDALGQAVFWESVKNIKSFSKNLHFGNNAAGVYVLTLLNENLAVSRKFVKR